MKEFYQNIPSLMDPVALRIGSFSIGWYPLMYIAAFLTVYLLLRFRIKKGEAGYPTQAGPRQGGGSLELLEKFIVYSFYGVLIGGRLGYVIFYNFSHYLSDPWAIISPFDAAGKFIGIYGMSYHGGLVGVILTTWYFCRNNRIEFWQWAAFVVPAIPAGFFFGRIGNFLNGELYGRITAKAWGMYFPLGGGMLRHPSQLYEAFFEGLILFLILWSLRNKKYFNNCHPELDSGSNNNKPLEKIRFRIKSGMTQKGGLAVLYIFLYGLLRFGLEFFREPDPQLGFILKWGETGLTMGQMLSLGMIVLSVVALLFNKDKKVYNVTS